MSGDSSAESDLQTLSSLSPSASQSSANVEPFALVEGQRVGRYTILERIGSGGMGVVYAAFDAKLDRKVALKLLHRRSDSQERLVREARSMAKLSHPNVVVIHDVGAHEGAVYMAMEFAPGRTLRSWLAEAKPSQAEILAVFLQAGEGLAAAHDERLVHRDFKPENVMVADSGRVKVMDFGLARLSCSGHSAEGASDPGSNPSTRGELHDGEITDGAGMVGTPAYMAPEQFGREPITEKTDQFSFCVALHEALYGARPFASDQVKHRLDATLEDPPAGSTVPMWLRAAIVRGLQRDAAARHPDMRTLLDALRSRPARRRRVVLAGSVIGTLVVAAGIAGTVDLATKRKCDATGQAFARVWTDDARDDITTSFATTGLPFAGDAAQRVTDRLDAWGTAWAEARADVCLEHERWRSADDPPARPEARCLEGLRVEVEELVTIWADAGRSGVIKGPRVTAGLTPPSRCLDPEYLARQPSLPPEDQRAEYERIYGELRRSAAAFEIGLGKEMLPRLDAAYESAVALGHEPLLAEIGYRYGRALHLANRNDEARARLEEAYFLAGRIRHDDVAAKAASALAMNKAQGGPSAEVELWAENARMMAERGDLQHTWDFTYVLADLAQMYDSIGKLEEAVATMRRCYELELELGPSALSPATVTTLGEALRRLGRYDEAEGKLTESIALTEEISGPDHPDLALPLLDRGSLYAQQGRFDLALADLVRAKAIAEQAEPLDNPLATILGALGAVYAERGDFESALAEQQRALVLQTETSGPEDPAVATWHMNLGITLVRLGRLAEAHEHYERTIAIRTAKFGPEHPALVSALVNLGSLHRKEKQLDESAAELERARGIAKASVRPGHPMALAVDVALAETRIDRGEHDEAAALLREALLLVDDDTPPATKAALEHELALALVGGGGNGMEARALGEAAAHRLEQSGADAERLKAIREWLAAQ